MAQLQPFVGNYLIALLIAILCSVSGFSLGIFFASVFENLSVALAVAPVTLLPLMVKKY